MSRQATRIWAVILAISTVLSGCHPTQPFYFREDGDLSHYLDVATAIETPDVETCSLDEVTEAYAPLTITNREFDEAWDLSLEEAVCTALKNSKAIRQTGNVQFRPTLGPGAIPTGSSDFLVRNAEFAPTVYDAALVESNPGGSFGLPGVEAALSDFDAQISTSLFWDRTDKPQNVSFFNTVNRQDLATFQAQVAKKTAEGTQWYFRNNTIYDAGNIGGAFRALPSVWETNFEFEGRHPLMRGGGTQVNRVPIVVARIRTDIALSDFEANVRNLVMETERAYWELYFYYRNLEATKIGRDSALVTWKQIHALATTGSKGGEAEKEAQAREQYFFFRGLVEQALCNLYKQETRLRYLMGLAATDGRLIRPCDDPTTAKIDFHWHDILCESMIRSPELRGQKWRIKQRELELLALRNQLLPQFDVVGLYRFLGLGDDLLAFKDNGANFPAPGSLALDELFEGRFQEWRFGLEFGMPVGFRRELAGVRYGQLFVAREKAVLEDMELEVSHQLTDSIQTLECNSVLTETNFNRRVAAEKQVEAVQAAYDAGTVTLDLLLDAQRRRADAEIAYYSSLAQYNIDIAFVHYRKGSLLEYDGVCLQEGPWPDKAYWDATGHARRRDASYYMDYGFTRPKVVSRGPAPQSAAEAGVLPFDGHMEYGPMPGDVEELQTPQPTPADQDMRPSSLRQPMPMRMPTQGPAFRSPHPSTAAAPAPRPATAMAAKPAAAGQSFDWGGLALDGGTSTSSNRSGGSSSSDAAVVSHATSDAADSHAGRTATSWKQIGVR